MKFAPDLSCINPSCAAYAQPGGENIFVRKLVGKDQIRFVRCRRCGSEFSERRGTAVFGFHLPVHKLISVVQHLAEGCGVRKTERLTGVHRDTVGRVLRAVGAQARAVHDELVRAVEAREVQMDEMWSFVKKKTKP